MRAVVALVEARPETIIEDYGRVIELAGFSGMLADSPVALVPQARPGGWFPGAGSPPWQLDGVLTWLDKRGDSARDVAGGKTPVVLPISPAGGPAPSEGWAWEDVMARHGAEEASDHFRRPRSFRAEPGLPALEAALPGGLNLHAGLRDRAALLLPVPALDAVSPVTGAVAQLRSLMAPDLRKASGEAADQILADVIRFSRQALPGLAVVMDAVLWQVGRVPGARRPVARNILLAGRDPVAVDAVAARLAGRDPERDSWFRLCRDQELGAVRESDIRLAGRANLMDLDFEVPVRATADAALGLDRLPLSGFLRSRFKRPSILKRHAQTPWGGLFDNYRAGEPTGDRR
jgi:hypothetical protein